MRLDSSKISSQQLRAARALLGLTQKDVHEITSISTGTLVKLEREGGHIGHFAVRDLIVKCYLDRGVVFQKNGVFYCRSKDMTIAANDCNHAEPAVA